MKFHADSQWILALLVTLGIWFLNSWSWSLFCLCWNSCQLLTLFCPCKELISEPRQWLHSCTRAQAAQAFPGPQLNQGAGVKPICLYFMELTHSLPRFNQALGQLRGFVWSVGIWCWSSIREVQACQFPFGDIKQGLQSFLCVPCFLSLRAQIPPSNLVISGMIVLTLPGSFSHNKYLGLMLLRWLGWNLLQSFSNKPLVPSLFLASPLSYTY
jgi:hypothetical protein